MIYVVGIGPGNEMYLTKAAEAIIHEADVVIGAKRNLEAIQVLKGQKIELSAHLKELLDQIELNRDKQIAILASGDPLIYGIGKYLAQHVEKDRLTIVPGISAIQYMFSRIQQDMNDLYITSSHGKTPDFDKILSHSKVAMVTDTLLGPQAIAEEILKRGLSKVMFVGENLSYPDERITIWKPEQLRNEEKFDMNVVVILDEK